MYGAAGERATPRNGSGSGSGYNSNESTIKIADPAAVLGREGNARGATTSAGAAAAGLSRSPPAGSAESAGPSETTRKRAEATKQYLETLYAMRKSRDKAKQERRDSLEKQLKLEKKSHVEIEERLKELDVRIHFVSLCIPRAFVHPHTRTFTKLVL